MIEDPYRSKGQNGEAFDDMADLRKEAETNHALAVRVWHVDFLRWLRSEVGKIGKQDAAPVQPAPPFPISGRDEER